MRRSNIQHLARRHIRALIGIVIIVYFFALSATLRRSPQQDASLPRWKKMLKPYARAQQEEESEFYKITTTSPFEPARLKIDGRTTEELCRGFPNHMLETIQPVLRIGHGQPREKLQAQLASVSACMEEDLIIFSDLTETFNGYQIIDVLDELPVSSYSWKNPVWGEYTKQKTLFMEGQLKEDFKIDGRALDKFKFLPMVERVWKMRPDKDWYVFYGADTFISWDNMFRFLDNLDPNMPLYMGSPAPGREKTWFAFEGAGFVLSRAAVKQLLDRTPMFFSDHVESRITQRYLGLLKEDCCGDSVLGWALHNAGISLSGFWPMFNPHHLHGLPFSDAYWCQPLLTLHNTDSQSMINLWRWEQSRRIRDRPLLYADIPTHTHPHVVPTRDNWQNSDWDSYRAPDDLDAHASFEDCGAACAQTDGCFQYGYHMDECTFVRVFRLGYTMAPKGTDDGRIWTNGQMRYRSGWDINRIHGWMMERECKEVQWVRPSVERKF